MAFKIELFVIDLHQSIHFYQEILGCSLMKQGENSALFKNEDTFLLLTGESILDEDHYFRKRNLANKGVGVELILSVDDVNDHYEQITKVAPKVIESPIKHQSWGATDFRVIDPDGYYIRVTSKG
ncbi:VOC family protein [Cytobacillus sp. FSL M8-0252]|uniref:VOC family protein n=1 Tax=Cytobacillus TaxID=2675230 RepID=UPI0025A1B7D2|nr:MULTISPECIES: VOC family protein [Cytobacillus]MDM5207682.1 VOC family protein [Cytobacillus kochii]MEA1852331.1 VOC family protein [Cytobacillus sp. OWB-43]